MEAENEWENLTAEEKKRKLYLEQKETLKTFLAHGTITQAQFDKSFTDLTIKMGYNLDEEKNS